MQRYTPVIRTKLKLINVYVFENPLAVSCIFTVDNIIFIFLFLITVNCKNGGHTHWLFLNLYQNIYIGWKGLLTFYWPKLRKYLVNGLLVWVVLFVCVDWLLLKFSEFVGFFKCGILLSLPNSFYLLLFIITCFWIV